MKKRYDFPKPILVVDDELGVIEIVTEFLHEMGFSTVSATNVDDGIARYKEHKPWLIVTDYNMEEKDGIELIRAVRSEDFRTVMILLTGFASKEIAIDCFKEGINDLFEKPIRKDDFQELIARHMETVLKDIEEELREMKEIAEMYVEESRELFEDIDNLLLKLEDDSVDSAVVDLLFRKVHTIKGGAGAVEGGQHLAKLTHVFESVLADVKNGELRPNADDVNALLEAADLTRNLLNLLSENTEPSAGVQGEIDTSVARLERCRDRKTGVSAEPPQPSSANASAKNVTLDDDRAEDGVWVPNEKLDFFMKYSGELVVLKNSLQILIRDNELKADIEKLDKKLTDFSYSLNKITDGIQDQIMSVRKVKLDKTFSKLPRLIRQVSRDLGKDVHAEIKGLELGVDTSVAKVLGACMTHLIRNSIDHGLEGREERLERGKKAEGNLEINVQEVSGVISVKIEDDGRGINTKKVAQIACDKALIDSAQAAKMSEQELQELIFMPGFSTMDEVTSVSGRGVGMDFVKSSIEGLMGRIQTDSSDGEGTSFHIEIPVPKSVMVSHTVLARSGHIEMAIPLVAISKIDSCRDLVVNEVEGVRVCQHMGSTIPLLTYDEMTKREGRRAFDIDRQSVVVVRHKSSYVGVVVDAIVGQLEAVVRPFDEITEKLPGFKGTAILGDDRIAYVLSPELIVGLLQPSHLDLAA